MSSPDLVHLLVSIPIQIEVYDMRVAYVWS